MSNTSSTLPPSPYPVHHRPLFCHPPFLLSRPLRPLLTGGGVFLRAGRLDLYSQRQVLSCPVPVPKDLEKHSGQLPTCAEG